MQPLVDDLQQMFEGVIMELGPNHFEVVTGVLGVCNCDLPALRKLLGLAGLSSTHQFCSKCHASKADKQRLRQFSRKFQTPRPGTVDEFAFMSLKTKMQATKFGKQWLSATTKAERDASVTEHGFRYTCFSKLSYFNVIEVRSFISS